MRTVLAAVLGLVAAVAACAALVLGLTAGLVTDPERPGRAGAVALSSPVLREEATDYLAAQVREEGVAAGLDPAQVDSALEQAVRDPRVRDAIADVEVAEDGTLDLEPLYDSVADRLEDGGRPGEAQRVRELSATSRGDAALADSLGDVVRTAMIALSGAALVAGIAALVAASLALAAARRRLLCLGAMTLTTGVLLALTLRVGPSVADDAGSPWLAAAGGLDDVLGPTGILTAGGLAVVGLLLALGGLRAPREQY